jgi:hypothetical protein
MAQVPDDVGECQWEVVDYYGKEKELEKRPREWR